MQAYLDQVLHNQDFHDCIEQNFKERFYDWRITVLFYIAVHCLKALAASKNPPIPIGDTHFAIERNVNPERKESTQRQTMPINKNAWAEYSKLQNYSREARYDGIENPEDFELDRMRDYQECLEHLRKFKMYIAGQGVPLPQTSTEKSSDKA